MAYTTKAKVDALYGTDIPSATFTSLLASVKAFIDKYTGKTFEAASATKYYDGNGKDELIIDALIGSPTSVKILDADGTVYDTLTEGQANDYVMLPLNSTEKNTIRLTGNGSYGRFQKREYLVEVVASFGGSTAVPADIELAATQMIGELFSGNQGDIKSESLGDYSVSYWDLGSAASKIGATNILDLYRDIDI